MIIKIKSSARIFALLALMVCTSMALSPEEVYKKSLENFKNIQTLSYSSEIKTKFTLDILNLLSKEKRGKYQGAVRTTSYYENAQGFEYKASLFFSDGTIKKNIFGFCDGVTLFKFKGEAPNKILMIYPIEQPLGFDLLECNALFMAFSFANNVANVRNQQPIGFNFLQKPDLVSLIVARTKSFDAQASLDNLTEKFFKCVIIFKNGFWIEVYFDTNRECLPVGYNFFNDKDTLIQKYRVNSLGELMVEKRLYFYPKEAATDEVAFTIFGKAVPVVQVFYSVKTLEINAKNHDRERTFEVDLQEASLIFDVAKDKWIELPK